MGDLKSAVVRDVTAVTKHTYYYNKTPTVDRKPNRKHSHVSLSLLRFSFLVLLLLLFISSSFIILIHDISGGVFYIYSTALTAKVTF